MTRRLGCALALGLFLLPHLGFAQQSPQQQQQPPTRSDIQRQLDAFRDQVNAGIVGVIAGGINGTYLRVATELADVLDNSEDGLRILPISGKGSMQNVWDLVFARGVDIALVQSDVIAYAKREKIFPKIDKVIQYVASLYDEEVHVLARNDIAQLSDLAGKKVNIDNRGSGTAMTASVIFGALGIAVERTDFDQALALQKLKDGEISALVYVAGKPARLFGELTPEDDVHFLGVSSTPELLQTYQRAQLGPDDYPRLLTGDQAIETLSVGAVMAAYAWPEGHERYRKVERFVDAFFSRSGELQNKPRHPKWHEVSLAAPLPGWTRFPAAEKWLKNLATASDESRQYESFMWFLDHVKPGGVGKPEERDALFAQYVQWRGAQRTTAANRADPLSGASGPPAKPGKADAARPAKPAKGDTAKPPKAGAARPTTSEAAKPTTSERVEPPPRPQSAERP
jgi:uncharacterized protein